MGVCAHSPNIAAKKFTSIEECTKYDGLCTVNKVVCLLGVPISVYETAKEQPLGT